MFFATKLVNAGGANGLLFGETGRLFVGNDPSQLMKRELDRIQIPSSSQPPSPAGEGGATKD
jgi:hypothetical protein